MKQEYIDVLIRVAPGPIGQGMTYKETAKDLNTTVGVVNMRLQRFKKEYPEAWEKFTVLRKMARQDRVKLRWKMWPTQEIGLKLFSELENSEDF